MMQSSTLARKALAEFLGTFWLVFAGCGSAVFAAAYPSLGIGFLGVALAFGLAVLTGAYAFGHVSGGHFNPAVTTGLLAAGRFPARDYLPYVGAQVLGAICASLVLYVIATGNPAFDISRGFAANGYAAHSPGGYSILACFVAEFTLTFMFVAVILGVTGKDAPQGFAPLAIGLALTLIHLVGIPISNTSVNPARSTGPALVSGGWALQQLWFFWVAPLLGGLSAGIAYGIFSKMPITRRPGVPETEEPKRPLRRIGG